MEKKAIGYYDYSDVLERLSNGEEPEENNSIQVQPTKAKPEDLTFSVFLEQFKIGAAQDNEKAQIYEYELIRRFEKDEGAFWRLSPRNTLNILQIAGYRTEDELFKAYLSVRSLKAYMDYRKRWIKKIGASLKFLAGSLFSSNNT